MFHEKPTFYFSPVDRHLRYGDFKTLGDIQQFHIKSPETERTAAVQQLYSNLRRTAVYSQGTPNIRGEILR